MRLRRLLLLALDLALGAALVVTAAHVGELLPGGARVELGRTKLLRLSDATVARLDSLQDQVFVTYYVTARERMPSHLRRIESRVTDLLAAMKSAAPGRFDYQVVDPDEHPDLARFAARRKVAPLRARHVTRDAWSEQELWSTLSIASGPRKPALIDGIGPEHLPRLQALMVSHLDQLENPRAPVYALAAPPTYRRFREMLVGRGEVLDVDLSAGAPIPPEADLLIWLDPGPVSLEQLRQLRAFLDDGRSLMLGGSSVRADLGTDADGAPLLLLEPSGFDADTLLGEFGLRPVAGLVQDGRSSPIVFADGTSAEAPFRIRCIAPNQDFHAASGDPNGVLMFVTPTPVEIDAPRLAAAGWRADVLATTGDDTWIHALDVDGRTVLPFSELVPEAGQSVAKQPLVTWLRPVLPWKGEVLHLASASVFHDGLYEASNVAHPRLARVLLDTLVDAERLVLAEASIERAEPLPPLSRQARVGWRLVVVGLLPVLLLLLARLRRDGAAVRATSSRHTGRALALGSRLVAGLVLAGWLAHAARGAGADLDTTSDRANTLAPATAELAAWSGREQRVRAELIVSSPEHLPPELRPAVRRLEGLLDDLRRAGADLEIVRRQPEDAGDELRAAWAAAGVEPVSVLSRQDEVTTVRSVWSALQLSRVVDSEEAGDATTDGGDPTAPRIETLLFPDAASFEDLEFRVAFALWRLRTGQHPHVAFASDVPRLSAAEAYQHYQAQGLIAPKGKDTYSVARGLLQRAGFRVTHVNPREPVVPRDVDAMVWLQPRRSVKPMLEAFSEYLYRGGRALLAAQHFNIQSRQYRGTEFEFVYWPQPQSPDVDLYWFPELGIRMLREVLFDRATVPVKQESQVTRGTRRDFLELDAARPDLIRAVSRHFDRSSPITRQLGDQAFLWADHFELDEARLSELGLAVTPLVTTTPDAWSYAWTGGWLPDEVLVGPPAEEGSESVDPASEGADPDVIEPDAAEPGAAEAGAAEADAAEADDSQPDVAVARRVGAVPMALLVEGLFPWPEREFMRMPMRYSPTGEALEREDAPLSGRIEPTDAAAPGALVLIASSEPFKDERLIALAPEYRGDHLLLNAVAWLALPGELADVMVRRPVPRGFGLVDQEQRLRWRGAVLVGGPALLLMFGGAWWLLRRGDAP